jgi:glutamine synthetase
MSPLHRFLPTSPKETVMTNLQSTAFLVESGVRLLLCTFVDNAGITRVKTIPIERLQSAVLSGLGLSPAFAVMCIDDHVTSTKMYGGPVGDLRLFPDLAASTIIEPEAGLAWAPLDQHNQELQRFPLCQRDVLRQQESSAAAHGLSFLVAFELEFTLFAPGGQTPAHTGPGYGMAPFLRLEQFSLDLIAALHSARVGVETLHPEYGPGQMEVSLAPRTPIAAVDQYILARLVVTRTAYKHGLDVSFAPMTIPDEIGNGCHIHFSASRDGKNVFAEGDGVHGLTPTAEHLLAGVVSHLQDAAGLFTPSVASYERLTPGRWSGAYACWGLENREAAVRLIRGTLSSRSESANVEVKSIDAACNPYLAVAAILGMALAGLDARMTLSSPTDEDPDAIPGDVRRARGISRLPTSLTEALDLFERSTVLRGILGDDLVDCLVAVRRYENETYSGKTASERIALVRARY